MGSSTGVLGSCYAVDVLGLEAVGLGRVGVMVKIMLCVYGCGGADVKLLVLAGWG